MLKDIHEQSKEDVRTLDFARPLCVAAHDLDSVRVNLLVVIQLEVDVFDNKRPNIVAEAVGIEVPLYRLATAGFSHKLHSAP